MLGFIVANAMVLTGSNAVAQQLIATPSDLRDGDPTFIGPPVIVPIAECSASVFVDGVIPGATVQLSSDRGFVSAPIVANDSLLRIDLGTHRAAIGESFMASQQLGGVQSPSAFRSVSPAGPISQPKLTPNPLLACGDQLVAIDVTPGSRVEFQVQTRSSESQPWLSWTTLQTVHAEARRGARSDVQGYAEASNYAGENYQPGLARFRAVELLCNGTGAASNPVVMSPLPPPSRWPTPEFVPYLDDSVYFWRVASSAGQSFDVVVGNLLPGHDVLLHERASPGMALINRDGNGNPLPSPSRLDTIVETRDTAARIRAFNQPTGLEFCAQQLVRQCDGSRIPGPISSCEILPPPPPSPPGAPPGTCATILPPRIADPVPGEMTLGIGALPPEITRVRVYQEGPDGQSRREIADGLGSELGLRDALRQGATLTVVIETSLAGCPVSDVALQVEVTCAPQETFPGPSAAAADGRPTYPVGIRDFVGPTYSTRLSGTPSLAGRVYYPAVEGGFDTAPLESLGDLPTLLLAHGKTGLFADYSGMEPTGFSCSSGPGLQPVNAHLGFEYFASEVAARGAIVVSLDHSALQRCGISQESGSQFDANIADRRDAILEFWDAFRSNRIATLSGVSAVSSNEIGFFGHSRGGQAAIDAARTCQSAPSCGSVSGVLALAASDGGVQNVMPFTRLGTEPDPLVGINLLVAGGTHDHDLSHIGVSHYDRASLLGSSRKAQALFETHHHNLFNSRLSREAGVSNFSSSPRRSHEENLLYWGISFFEVTIFNNESHWGLFDESARFVREPSTTYQRSSRSSMFIVEDFEAASLGQTPSNVTVDSFTSATVEDGTSMPQDTLFHASRVLDLAPSGPPLAPPNTVGTTDVTISLSASAQVWSDSTLFIDLAANHYSRSIPLDFARLDDLVDGTTVLASLQSGLYAVELVDLVQLSPADPLGRQASAPRSFLTQVRIPLRCLRRATVGGQEPVELGRPFSGGAELLNSLRLLSGPSNNWFVVDDIELEY